MYDETWITLWSRIHRYTENNDVDGVMAPQALAELQELFDAVNRPITDPGVTKAQLLGRAIDAGAWLHWCRFKIVGPARERDLRRALAYFSEMFPVDPSKVPPELHDYFIQFAETDAHTDIFAAVCRNVAVSALVEGSDEQFAVTLLEHAGELFFAMSVTNYAQFEDNPKELSKLDHAIGNGCMAIDSSLPETKERATYARHLGQLRETRFAIRGDRGDINEAMRLVSESQLTGNGTSSSWYRLAVLQRLRFDVFNDLNDLNNASS